MLHTHDDKPTVPMDYRPPDYERHTAECAHAHDDDKCKRGEGSGAFVVALVTVTLVIVVGALMAALR